MLLRTHFKNCAITFANLFIEIIFTMASTILAEAAEKLQRYGYELSFHVPGLVHIKTPTGFTTKIRVKRLPSYAMYVH